MYKGFFVWLYYNRNNNSYYIILIYDFHFVTKVSNVNHYEGQSFIYQILNNVKLDITRMVEQMWTLSTYTQRFFSSCNVIEAINCITGQPQMKCVINRYWNTYLIRPENQTGSVVIIVTSPQWSSKFTYCWNDTKEIYHSIVWTKIMITKYSLFVAKQEWYIVSGNTPFFLSLLRGRQTIWRSNSLMKVYVFFFLLI